MGVGVGVSIDISRHVLVREEEKQAAPAEERVQSCYFQAELQGGTQPNTKKKKTKTAGKTIR